MKILAIETSCDDTGIAILSAQGKDTPDKDCDFKVLANIVASQIELGKKYGGVYPILAKREHQKNLVPVLKNAFKQAELLVVKKNNKKIDFGDILKREPELQKKITSFLKKYERPNIDLISVTNGPGLEPCLWVGVNFAKALSYFWNIPIVPTNHIEAHILVNFLNPIPYALNPNSFPAIALVVSGGHTQIILVKKIGDYKIIGETRDDAAGECFDKCAKILGLSYPGGPIISKLAAQAVIPSLTGNIDSRFRGNDISLPRPMINTKDYDFSFSGLKTAVLYADKKIIKKDKKYKIEMATEIQQAIIDVLVKKTINAVKDFKAKSLILGGGVSANRELRSQLESRIKNQELKINLMIPPTNLSTDNALMTAVTGYFTLLRQGSSRQSKNKKIVKSDLTKISADGNLRIE